MSPSQQKKQVDERISVLEASVRELNERLNRMEAQLAPATHIVSPAAAESLKATEPEEPDSFLSTTTVSGGLGQLLPLIGRSFLVFGGAFLLRALTDAGVVPHGIGVVLGLLYAIGWLFAAWRTEGRENRLNREFHGVTAVIIAFPMLVETTIRFELMSAAAAAAVLIALLTTTLVTLWRRRLPATAMALSIAAPVAALVLARFTFRVELFTAVMVAFAVISWGFALRREYRGMQWIPALTADLMVLAACFMVSAPGGPRAPYEDLSPGLMLLTAVALLVGYLGSAAKRVLASHGSVQGFDVFQTAAAIAIGLGGSARIVGSSGSLALAVGSTAVLLGLSFYALAFAFVERRHGRGAGFFFATSTGLALCVFGGSLATDGGILGVVWCLLGLAAAAGGGHFDRITLRAHAAVFTVLAAGASGLAAATAHALFSAAGELGDVPSIAAWATLVGILLSYALLVFSQSAREGRWYARLPRFVIAATAGLALLAVAIRIIINVAPVGLSDPAVLAATRSMLLAAAVIGLAAAGRSERVRELAWLVYPMLGLAGCRLLLFDLRLGRGITLFPTFALFGLALLLTPRLMRRRKSPAMLD